MSHSSLLVMAGLIASYHLSSPLAPLSPSPAWPPSESSS
jgi:hypothetical protein